MNRHEFHPHDILGCLLKDRGLRSRREHLKNAHASIGVAFFIQPWAPGRDAVMAGVHGDDSAADSALTRQSDLEGKFPGLIIKPAQLHDRINSLRLAHAYDSFLRERIHSIRGKKRKTLS